MNIRSITRKPAPGMRAITARVARSAVTIGIGHES